MAWLALGDACGYLTYKVELRSAFETGAGILTLLGCHQAYNLMPVAPSVPTNVR